MNGRYIKGPDKSTKKPGLLGLCWPLSTVCPLTEMPSSFQIAVHLLFGGINFVFLFPAAVVCHPVVSVCLHVLSVSSSFLFVSCLIPSFDTQGYLISSAIDLTLRYHRSFPLSAVLADVVLPVSYLALLLSLLFLADQNSFMIRI